MTVALRWIRPGEAGYEGERELRWRVLREPLGMPPGSEENAAEATCWHLIAVDGEAHDPERDGVERVVGCLIFRDDRDPAPSPEATPPLSPGEGALDQPSGLVPSRVRPARDGRGQLMQMAVDPRQRGGGVGRALVRELERRAREAGIHTIYLHARAVAIGFYERLGYAVYGEPYTEVGIPHRHMTRRIT